MQVSVHYHAMVKSAVSSNYISLSMRYHALGKTDDDFSESRKVQQVIKTIRS